MCGVGKIFMFLWVISSFYFAHAQNDYGQQWHDIKLLAKTDSNRVKSKLINLQNIAIQENNASQIIRTLEVEYALISNAPETKRPKAINNLFIKIKQIGNKLSGNQALFYQNMMSSLVTSFYFRGWLLSANPIDFEQKQAPDISRIVNWTKIDFQNYLLKDFENLDQNKQKLKSLKLSDFKSAFSRTEDIQYFPTMYDWLVLTEIEILQLQQLFGDNSLKRFQSRIDQLYQTLISTNNENPKLYFSFRYINWLKSAKFQSDEQYRNNLTQLADTNVNGDYRLFIISELLKVLKEKNPTAAVGWYEKSKSLYPQSEFHHNLDNVMADYINQKLEISLPSYAFPNQPAKLEIFATNLQDFTLRIFKITDIKDFIKFEDDQTKLSTVGKEFFREDHFHLKAAPRGRTVTSELELKPLPAGLYLMEAVSPTGKIGKATALSVTPAAVLFKNLDHRTKTLLLVDRENGDALPRQKVTFYDDNGKISNYKTNSKGEFNSNTTVAIFYTTVAQTGEIVIISRRPKWLQESEQENKSMIALNKSEYKQGDQIYFKFIARERQGDSIFVIPGQKKTIALLDPTGKPIKKTTFTTDSTGSFTGSFNLPENQTGFLRLEIEGEKLQQNLYVRPQRKQQITMKISPIPDKIWKLGDTLLIKGIVLDSLQQPLKNTPVKYHKMISDYRYRYFKEFQIDQIPTKFEIDYTETDSLGNFTIPYILRDLAPNEKGIKVFHDFINCYVEKDGKRYGDTAGAISANVDRQLKMESVEPLFTDQPLKVIVKSTDFLGQKLSKPFHLQLIKYHKLRYHLISEATAEPEDLEKVVFDSIESKDTLLFKKFPEGHYQLRIYDLYDGQSTGDSQVFTIWNRKKSNLIPDLKGVFDQKEYGLNEKGNLYVYSGTENAIVRIYLQTGDGVTRFSRGKIKNGVFKIPFKVISPTMNFQIAVMVSNQGRNLYLDVPVKTTKKTKSQILLDTIKNNDGYDWSAGELDAINFPALIREAHAYYLPLLRDNYPQRIRLDLSPEWVSPKGIEEPYFSWYDFWVDHLLNGDE